MHVFHFKMYNSAFFLPSVLSMNFTPYSPSVTWDVCDEFAAFTTFGTEAVYLLVFGQVVAFALSPNLH